MKLKIIHFKTQKEMQEFDLASALRHNGKCVVGRSATSGLILENSDISRNHGEFSYKSGGYYFTDTGSSNGSLINDKVALKGRAYLLKDGDRIRLGDFLLIPQPITGAYEDATVSAPIPFTSLSNELKPGDSEISSSPEIIREIAQPADEFTPEELPAAIAAQPEAVKQSDIEDIPLEEPNEDISAKVTDILAVPEILKEKYIVFLAHDSKKAELVDFIKRHQVTFSKCLLMAPSTISDALLQHNIVVSRQLSNLTAVTYQEVNSEIASKNILSVIFLRDFLIPQSLQANDEALSRACNVNQVILATNIATAQAFEGYLQHLIASTPKVSLTEGSKP